MSKIKKFETENKISTEKIPKKKFNKRQRQIRKKLKVSRKKYLNVQNKDSSLNKTENIKSHSKTNQLKSPLKTSNAVMNELPQVPDKETKKLKPVADVKNPENYSSNWKKLKNLISGSVSKQEPQQSKKRKRECLNAQESISTSDKNESEIWFDDVDPILLEDGEHTTQKSVEQQSMHDKKMTNIAKSLKKENSFTGNTKIIALDCEMVGGGVDGEDDILARISIVNHFGNVLYDKYVKPREPVKDYRTKYSGIRPKDLVNGELFDVVQKEVSELMEGRIVVGHALHNDFGCLFLSHPKHMIRDTSRYRPFIKLFGRGTPSLKNLSAKVLGVTIQSGEHDSIQDAQAAMRLYTLHRKEWENRRLKATRGKRTKTKLKAGKESTVDDGEKI